MNVKNDMLESNNFYEHWGILKIISIFSQFKKNACEYKIIIFFLNFDYLYLKRFGRQKF